MSASGFCALCFSRRISASIESRMASLHARWQTSVRSAPLKPWVTLAMYIRSMSCEDSDLNKNQTIETDNKLDHFAFLHELYEMGCVALQY